jgi:hypothetical protein
MDTKYFASIGIIFVVLSLAGFVISLISSQLQCSKIDLMVSLKQGFISSAFPVFVYAIAVYFPIIRNPFVTTLESFGIKPDSSSMYGVAYLVMLAFWITTVSNVHNTETASCKPSEDEMTEFKKKLLADLSKKRNEKVNKGQE